MTMMHAAESFIAENGQPQAEFVVAEKPTRMQRVASHEFRLQIEKISGARLPGDIGKPDSAITQPEETLDIWDLDERGSLKAVCGYLRKLGASWYLPSFAAHAIGDSVNATKGVSAGEDIWLSVAQDFATKVNEAKRKGAQ